MGYIWLSIAIVAEVFGSSMLKLTDGFKRLFPSLGVVFGYGIAFYALSLSLNDLHLGAVYAIWAGVGTALTALIGIIFYKEMINLKKTFGILMVIGGIVLLNSGI